MTTFRCDPGRAGGPSGPLAALRLTPRGYLGPKKGALAALALLVAASGALAQELTLPSGLPATLYDVVLEQGGSVLAPDAFTDPEAGEDGEAAGEEPFDQPVIEAARETALGGLARFRLVVPGLGGEGLGYEAVAGDFAWLCEAVALPALAANAWAPTEVVVALSDREVAFGATDPGAVQFFEGFRIADGACIPQAF